MTKKTPKTFKVCLAVIMTTFKDWFWEMRSTLVWLKLKSVFNYQCHSRSYGKLLTSSWLIEWFCQGHRLLARKCWLILVQLVRRWHVWQSAERYQCVLGVRWQSLVSGLQGSGPSPPGRLVTLPFVSECQIPNRWGNNPTRCRRGTYQWRVQ